MDRLSHTRRGPVFCRSERHHGSPEAHLFFTAIQRKASATLRRARIMFFFGGAPGCLGRLAGVRRIRPEAMSGRATAPPESRPRVGRQPGDDPGPGRPGLRESCGHGFSRPGQPSARRGLLEHRRRCLRRSAEFVRSLPQSRQPPQFAALSRRRRCGTGRVAGLSEYLRRAPDPGARRGSAFHDMSRPIRLPAIRSRSPCFPA